MSRLRALRRSGDEGVTLAELLVTMMLLALLGVMLMTMFMATSKASLTSERRVDNTTTAQIGMETLSRNIRAATKIEQSGASALPAFVSIDATSMELYSFTGNRPVKIKYSVDSSKRLVETRLPADASSAAPFYKFTGTPTTRVVIDRVVNTASQPLFRYYDDDDAGPNQIAYTTNATLLEAVRSVDITLVVQADDQSRVPPAELQHLIFLPNLGAIS